MPCHVCFVFSGTDNSEFPQVPTPSPSYFSPSDPVFAFKGIVADRRLALGHPKTALPQHDIILYID